MSASASRFALVEYFRAATVDVGFGTATVLALLPPQKSVDTALCRVAIEGRAHGPQQIVVELAWERHGRTVEADDLRPVLRPIRPDPLTLCLCKASRP